MRRVAVVFAMMLGAGCRDRGSDERSRSDIETQAGGHEGHDSMPGMSGGEGEPAVQVVRVSPQAVAALGIRTVPARTGESAGKRRAPATVTYDPARLVQISAQPGGQVRALTIPRLGEKVQAAQVVARLYSPEVRAAFEELLLARDLGEPWIDAARQRLRNGGVLDAEIDRAMADAKVPETYVVRAPASGIVTARPVAEGTWIAPGGVLAVLAQEGSVVVDVVTPADHPEVGTPIALSDPASTETWKGEVRAVLAAGDAAGHAVRVDVRGAPPRVGRPLVAEWETPAVSGVWVPRGAVIDTGERQAVFVAAAEGGYESRNVKLGARTADEIQVVEGLAAGEAVVAAGTFLLDSETQMTTPGHAGHGE